MFTLGLDRGLASLKYRQIDFQSFDFTSTGVRWFCVFQVWDKYLPLPKLLSVIYLIFPFVSSLRSSLYVSVHLKRSVCPSTTLSRYEQWLSVKPVVTSSPRLRGGSTRSLFRGPYGWTKSTFILTRQTSLNDEQVKFIFGSLESTLLPDVLCRRLTSLNYLYIREKTQTIK